MFQKRDPRTKFVCKRGHGTFEKAQRGRAGAWRGARVHTTWTGACRCDEDLGLYPERRVEGSGKALLRGGEGAGQRLTMIFGTEWPSGCSMGSD